ncbi:hypothetical protein LLG96_07155 [bacterium]|nr:hypothetical protein [bacterium]
MAHTTPFLALLTFLLTIVPPPAAAEDAVTAGRFIVEPPTLQCAGFEWYIDGDDNRTAAVAVRFREQGTAEWREALPLLRLQYERIVHKPAGIDFTAPNMFAGSIFGLKPGGTYECQFTMTDPEGVTGTAVRTAVLTTRVEPRASSTGRVRHVYPPGYEGEKQEPSYTGIMSAFYGPGGGLWQPADIEPGDIILVHAGTYLSDRRRYYEPMWMHFHGCYQLTKSGTPDQPIVIRAAGDGEVILDGDGVYRLFDVMFADNIYFEGLTIKNCEIGILAGLRYTEGCDGLVVRKCKFENVGCAINAQFPGSRNFYIADNVILGRERQDVLRGWTGPWTRYKVGLSDLQSFIAIDINGQGHAVCHNYIAYFHDAIDITEQGEAHREDWQACSNDFYNNDLHVMADDLIEADSSTHNIRVFNNRGINSGQQGLSAQPIFGGPAYFIRNIVYNVLAGSFFKFNIYPAGIYVYHNTLFGEWINPPFSNVHCRNNLFIGTGNPDRPLFRNTSYTSYTTLDYNGWGPNPGDKPQFTWKQARNGRDFELKDTTGGSWNTLAEFSDATGFEKHGVLVDYKSFRNVPMPDLSMIEKIYFAKQFDFRLAPGSPAIDAGCLLPNINDGYKGKAPDLGALEVGGEDVVYGPR